MTPSLTDKVAVLTGNNEVGQEIAAQLLNHDIAKIYLLASADTKSVWSERMGLKEEDITKRVEFLPCDLSDITAVKKIADELVGKLHRLDILFFNADIPASKDCALSPQGIENTFAVNMISHFVLSQILLLTIEDTAENYGEARIITASSPLYIGCQELDFNLLKSSNPVKSSKALDACWRYARSKLGATLFTQKLVHRLYNHGAMTVYANAFFPGNIPTDDIEAWKELIGTVPGASAKGVFDMVGKSPENGAAAAIYLAASEEVREKNLKGRYFSPIGEESESTEVAKDKDLARNLWYWCDAQVTQVLGKGWEDVNDRE